MQFSDVVNTDKAMQTIGIQISIIGRCARTKIWVSHYFNHHYGTLGDEEIIVTNCYV